MTTGRTAPLCPPVTVRHWMTKTRHFRIEVVRRPTSIPKPPTDSRVQISLKVLGRSSKRTLMKGIRCQSRQTGSPFRIRNGLPSHNGTVESLSEYSTTLSQHFRMEVVRRPTSNPRPPTDRKVQIYDKVLGRSSQRISLTGIRRQSDTTVRSVFITVYNFELHTTKPPEGGYVIVILRSLVEPGRIELPTS
jgi:hypothetical protein